MRRRSCNLAAHHRPSTASLLQQLKPLIFSSLSNSLSTLSAVQLPARDDAARFQGVIHDKDLLRMGPEGNTLLVLDLIDQGSMEPDARLYADLLKRCTDQGKLRVGQMVYTHFSASRYRHYAAIRNTAINMCAKCGDMKMARKVFDEMIERDMVSYTMLITGYSHHNEFKEALFLYLNMLRIGLRPNEFTFGSALKSAGGLQSYVIGGGIHGSCLRSGFEENLYVGSALVDMYARCKRMEDAKVVFNGLHCKNEVSWNALIAAYAREGEGHHAVALFSEMKRGGYGPTHFTYSSIFAACAGSGAMEQGRWAHADMVKSGTKLIAFVGNTLLDMYGKAGSIEDANRVFRRLVKKDVVSWNSMLTAYAQHGFGEQAVSLFEEMRGAGFQPNGITFLCVLTACSHAGLVDQGLHYFNLMRKYEQEPDITHCVSVVDLLGRAGQLDRALCFIQEMRVKPTAAVWKALLGACRMYRNTNLGTYAAEQVFKLDPLDSGPHVLLSNIYASTGQLGDAARVRKAMGRCGVKKEPACSWVEIGGAVHVFLANDDTNPEREEIRVMWEKMRDGIMKIGYVPDTRHVLWYVDEREREERLQCHSEKLALAFALLKMPPGLPISIKKNIRVCGDCHTAFKFVSKLVGREIVLRDTNRFHHFNGGSCSCRDYW
ncbi:Tetratricopeptide repeat (TPR)-like superfamily protein [Striga hermonthica]|uniref:Tetratricopeptide repeat (TPR)-like superfamily protein n=1 Tax=Striga hermonthica TaxID=68872 RepID=A0A9N7NGF1_STRHE|nr:Tetratricopeptide repeat (TPR)-like superfamily protein [Striga hermonthica]